VLAYNVVNSGARTQAKVRNLGRRDLIDLSVLIRVSVPSSSTPGITEMITISQWDRPILRGRQEITYSIRPEHMTEDEQRKSLRVLPRGIAEKIRVGESVDVVELLEAAPGSRISVYVFESDSFSGARGYTTATYNADQIMSGRFASKSYAVVPAPADPAEANRTTSGVGAVGPEAHEPPDHGKTSKVSS